MNIDTKKCHPESILCLLFLVVVTIALGPLTTSSYGSTPPTIASGVNSSIVIVESEGIVPVGIHTEPSLVHVGDRFSIDASIFNYSPLFVQIPDGGCSPTGLTATFDSNVVVSPGAQFIVCYEDSLTPAQTISARAGWPSENYTATTPGLTNATLHLVYSVVGDDNQTELRQYDTEFQFTIVPTRQFGQNQ